MTPTSKTNLLFVDLINGKGNISNFDSEIKYYPAKYKLRILRVFLEFIDDISSYDPVIISSNVVALQYYSQQRYNYLDIVFPTTKIYTSDTPSQFVNLLSNDPLECLSFQITSNPLMRGHLLCELKLLNG
jgi:hypothetical protein